MASREVITDIGEGRDWYVRQFYEYCNLIEGVIEARIRDPN